MNRPVLILAALMLLGAGQPAMAQRVETIRARAGGAYAQRQAHVALCDYAARHSVVVLTKDPPDAYRYANPILTEIGVDLGMFLISPIDRQLTLNQRAGDCVRRLGYVDLPLTDAEARAHRAARGAAESRAWEEAFLGQDLGARVAAAMPRIMPVLPPYQDAPWIAGSVKVDPASLQLTPGPQGEKAVILRGKAERRATARLMQGFEVETPVRPATVRFAEGAVFHQVEYRARMHPLLMTQAPLWCGPAVAERKRNGEKVETNFCFLGVTTRRYPPTYSGSIVHPMEDRIGHSSAEDLGQEGLAIGLSALAYNGQLRLDPLERDPAGPMDFEIALTKVSGGAVTLKATTKVDGPGVIAFELTLPIIQNRVVLPMWDRQLVLTVAGGRTMTASFESGDGRGWFDLVDVNDTLKGLPPEILAASTLSGGLPPPPPSFLAFVQ